MYKNYFRTVEIISIMEQGRRAEQKVFDLNDAILHERSFQTMVRELNETQAPLSPKKEVGHSKIIFEKKYNFQKTGLNFQRGITSARFGREMDRFLSGVKFNRPVKEVKVPVSSNITTQRKKK